MNNKTNTLKSGLIGLTLGLGLLANSAAAAEGDDYANHFEGPYIGLEGGLSSIGTELFTNLGNGGQEASGVAINGFAGYNFVRGRLVLGAEAHFGISTAESNVAVNPAVFTFTNLNAKRGVSFGVDGKIGLLVGKAKRVMVYGSVGFANNRMKLAADGTDLGTFIGGGAKSSASFTGLRIGGGIEVAVNERIRVRFSAHKQKNKDLTGSDFNLPNGALGITSASVVRKEVQVLGGVLISF